MTFSDYPERLSGGSENWVVRRAGRRVVSALFLINGFLIGVWASRIPAITVQYDLTPGMLGTLLLVLASGAVIAFPISGYFMDRMGSGHITRVTTLAYVGSMVLIPLAPSILTLAIALWLFGAVHGAMDVAMNGWGAKLEKACERPIMSSFHALFSVGTGLGAASTFIAATLGIGLLPHMVVASILSAVVLGWGWRQPEGCDLTPSSKQKAPLFIFPRGQLLAIALIAACSAIGEGGNADWGGLFLMATTDVDEAGGALAYTVFSLAMVTARFAGDRLIALLGPERIVRYSGLAALLGGLITMFAQDVLAKLCGFVFLGAGFALIAPIVYSRAANDKDLPPGAGLASVAIMGYGGFLVGPVIIGGLASLFGISSAFGIMIFLGTGVLVFSRALATRT
tara:strand:+ start:247 stop:1437 length:1191 start_codon:yes stop_codon:yes gene_type:complete